MGHQYDRFLKKKINQCSKKNRSEHIQGGDDLYSIKNSKEQGGYDMHCSAKSKVVNQTSPSDNKGSS